MGTPVRLTKSAIKDLKKLPQHLVDSFRRWRKTVEEVGLLEVRKCPSYHDEPLYGKRAGQRSVSLNLAYRVIYQEESEGITVVLVLEINKHQY